MQNNAVGVSVSVCVCVYGAAYNIFLSLDINLTIVACFFLRKQCKNYMYSIEFVESICSILRAVDTNGKNGTITSYLNDMNIKILEIRSFVYVLCVKTVVVLRFGGGGGGRFFIIGCGAGHLSFAPVPRFA